MSSFLLPLQLSSFVRCGWKTQRNKEKGTKGGVWSWCCSNTSDIHTKKKYLRIEKMEQKRTIVSRKLWVEGNVIYWFFSLYTMEVLFPIHKDISWIMKVWNLILTVNGAWKIIFDLFNKEGALAVIHINDEVRLIEIVHIFLKLLERLNYLERIQAFLIDVDSRSLKLFNVVQTIGSGQLLRQLISMVNLW